LVNETTLATCPAINDLANNATFVCFSASAVVPAGTATVLGEVALDLEVNEPDLTSVNATVQIIAYIAASVTNKPALFGFEYVNVNYATTTGIAAATVKVDAIAAFYTLYEAFEFVPNTPDNSFSLGVSTKVGTTMTFTGPTISPCSITLDPTTGSYYSRINYVYPGGWEVNCRFTNIPITEAGASAIKLSPSQSKCDLVFGSFSYSGQNNTRLGVVLAFVVAGASATVATDPSTVITKCKTTDGICLFLGGASKAGVFTWASSTNRTSGVVVSGVTAYTGSAGDFFFPGGLTGSQATQYIGSTSLDVTTFGAANIAVFSFANPTSGDVWDPALAQSDSSTLNPTSSSKTSAGSVFTYSFALIIAALIAKYL